MKIVDSSSDEEEVTKPKVDYGRCTWMDCAFPTTPTDVKCTECATAFHSFHRDATPKCALHYSSKRAGRPAGHREQVQKGAENRKARLSKAKANAVALEELRSDGAQVTHHDIIPSTILHY